MRVVLTGSAVFVAIAISYVGACVVAHRDSTLVYLRDSGRAQRANLVPAIFPPNTGRFVIYDHFKDRGFRGPFKLMRDPNGELHADEGWSMTNLFWHYDIRFIYDDEGHVIDGWGIAFEPGAK